MAIIVSQVKTTLEESSNQDRIWEAARKTAIYLRKDFLPISYDNLLNENRITFCW